MQQLVAQSEELSGVNKEHVISKRGTSCSQIENTFNFLPLFQIPWGQNIVIISKCKTIEDALFYVQSTVKYGWSRSVLSLQIKSKLYKREGKAITNFEQQLPTVEEIEAELLRDTEDNNND